MCICHNFRSLKEALCYFTTFNTALLRFRFTTIIGRWMYYFCTFSTFNIRQAKKLVETLTKTVLEMNEPDHDSELLKACSIAWARKRTKLLHLWLSKSKKSSRTNSPIKTSSSMLRCLGRRCYWTILFSKSFLKVKGSTVTAHRLRCQRMLTN